eukprot:gene11687-15649_t
MFFQCVVVSALLSAVAGFKTFASRSSIKPLYENFGLSIGEDPVENTPKEIFGEVNYKSFAAKTVPDGLLSRQYNIIERVRELKLLSLTADSGLLEALESKGLTLSTLEKLLPVADDLSVLPLANKNKDLLLSLAPLIIEPAPLLIPVLVSIIKDPSKLTGPGGLFIGLGGYELITDNGLLGIPLLLLGLPLFTLGSIISGSISVPVPTTSTATTSTPTVTSKPKVVVDDRNRPVAKKVKPVPVAVAVAKPAPQVIKTVDPPKASLNGKRKTIKIR